MVFEGAMWLSTAIGAAEEVRVYAAVSTYSP